MSRVLLFADFGQGLRYVCRMTQARASDTWFTWGANTKDPRPTARRWWLVECESAEAGRAAIKAFERPLKDYESPSVLPCAVKSASGIVGRILDSGTNEARP